MDTFFADHVPQDHSLRQMETLGKTTGWSNAFSSTQLSLEGMTSVTRMQMSTLRGKPSTNYPFPNPVIQIVFIDRRSRCHFFLSGTSPE